MANRVVWKTEQQVLKALHITDFRHLSKDKIMTFFSMLPSMDPEVAKKALEQYPTFAGTVKDIISDYLRFFEKALADDAQSVNEYYTTCQTILSTLSKMLENENLSFEEKQFIIEKMLEVEERVNMKDTETKKHRFKLFTWASVVVLGLVGALAGVLGLNSGFSLPKIKDDDTDDFNTNNEYDESEGGNYHEGTCD